MNYLTKPLDKISEPLSRGASILLITIVREMVLKQSPIVLTSNTVMAKRGGFDVDRIQVYQRELEVASLVETSYDERQGIPVASHLARYRIKHSQKRVPKRRDGRQ